MIQSLIRSVYIFAVLLIAAVLASCSGGGGGGAETGFLSLGLTDNPGDYLNVFVTIGEVQVKQNLDEGESGWITAYDFAPDVTVDLLELRNGNIMDFGLAELPIGQYGQLRLILGELPPGSEHDYPNYVKVEGETEGEILIEPLTVSSGYQTGIKILHGFTITAGAAVGATQVILDFDAEKSVVEAQGNSGWHLKPTIKGLETFENSISGTVIDYDTESPIPGATVSAQIFDANGVVIESTITETSGEGRYKIFLPPDVYGVVVTEDTHLPACQVVEALYYEDYVSDFSLFSRVTAADINLIVNVTGVDEGESAFLSIRQPGFDCAVSENGTISADIEVALKPVTNESYDFNLPELPAGGYYNLVAYTSDETIEFTEVDPAAEIEVAFTPSP